MQLLQWCSTKPSTEPTLGCLPNALCTSPLVNGLDQCAAAGRHSASPTRPPLSLLTRPLHVQSTSLQMGWISVQQLDGTVLKPGTRKQVWLGSHSVAPNAGVRILTPWVNGSDPIFLGFRTAAGGGEASMTCISLHMAWPRSDRSSGAGWEAGPARHRNQRCAATAVHSRMQPLHWAAAWCVPSRSALPLPCRALQTRRCLPRLPSVCTSTNRGCRARLTQSTPCGGDPLQVSAQRFSWSAQRASGSRRKLVWNCSLVPCDCVPLAAPPHPCRTPPLATPPPAAPGASWAHAPSGLVVRFVSLANGGANVMICRKASPAKETLASCKAGQDYDCNGKVGFADPACKALLTAAGLAPPPPSRPPPAPRPPPPLRRPPPPTPVVRTGRLLRQAQ